MLKNLNASMNANTRRILLNETMFNKSNLNNQFNASYLSNTTGHTLNNCDKSWFFYNQFANNNLLNEDQNQDQLFPVNNPNKALVVINGRTTEILTANDISGDLFGFSDDQLIGMKLKDLLDLNEHVNSDKKEALIETDRLDQNGRVVLCSGKIFEACIADPLGSNKNQSHEKNDEMIEEDENNKCRRLKIPISIFMLKLTDEQEPKCLCVMEPIQRIVGTFTINFKV